MEDQQTSPASNVLDNFFNIAFDAATRAQVKQAAVWAKVCALSAFIGYSIALVVAIFAQQDDTTETQVFRIGVFFQSNSLVGVVITTLTGVIINYFLYRFAAATARGMDAMDNVRTNEGFNNLRIYFKICGILLIVALSFLVLVVLVALIGLGVSGR
jgi:hypothetical protein